jgi:hypothetical protein
VAGVASDIPTVADNVSNINDYANTYQGAKATAPTLRNNGGALLEGDMYFNTTSDTMFVYGSGGWVPAGSSVNGTSQRYKYVATSGQTSFSGTDANGNTLTYDAGFIDVYLNGVHLDPTDYTATTGTSVVLGSGAALNDELYIVAFGTFNVASFNGSGLDDGTVNISKLSATGTRSSATALRGDNTFGNITPTEVSDETNTSTGYFDLPSGTTAQRPGSPPNGASRFNTDLGFSEYWTGTQWALYGNISATSVSYLIAAGGGGGGSYNSGGGGGAGGLLIGTQAISAGTSYSITVGAGGAGSLTSPPTAGINGSNSSFSAVGTTAIGGGRGGMNGMTGVNAGASGGSGGGGAQDGTIAYPGGSGTSGQGNAGGAAFNSAPNYPGGGGGGAGAAGQAAPNSSTSGNGGAGLASSISGSSTFYAGGGAGSVQSSGGTAGTGGAGGGGNGGNNTVGGAGSANTGGGGGAGASSFNGGNGGSGVVIIAFASTFKDATATGSFTKTSAGGNIVYTFTGSGTITF